MHEWLYIGALIALGFWVQTLQLRINQLERRNAK